MKRKADSSTPKPRAPTKKPRSTEAEYCDTPPLRDADGDIIWPAPKADMERARRIILECAAAKATAVICPDKDADGLSSGVILHRTLTALGMPHDRILVHLLPKGETVHTDGQRAALAALLSSIADAPSHHYLFVLDHGSAASPALAPPETSTTLIIDHHFATPTSFPTASVRLSASTCPPIATTALLTHTLCAPLTPSLPLWLPAIGTHGDLGTSLHWRHPFPDMSQTFSTHSRKSINTAASLLNAPRRSPAYDVRSAWNALLAATSPSDIPSHPRLLAARAQVNAEISRCNSAPPVFAKDGSVALVRISSPAQIHPVIATRWANTLNSKRLRFVACANDAYLAGRINFSCRVAKCARRRIDDERAERGSGDGDEGQDASPADVDIIAELKAIAQRHASGTLLRRLGPDFARGHVQASGGVVGVEEFEELMGVLRVGEKPDRVADDDKKSPKKKKKVGESGQRNTIMSYFGRAA